MPDEAVDLSSPGGGTPKNAKFSLNSGNSSVSGMSDGEEDHASRLAELQEQVGAEQVGFHDNLVFNEPLVLSTGSAAVIDEPFERVSISDITRMMNR